MRILLADDRSIVRFALRTLLERQPGIEVVGEAANSEGLLNQVKTTCPDLVLLDWSLLDAVANDLLPILREADPELSVIVLSGRPEMRRTALTAGADAFVSKTDPPERLLNAIRFVDGMRAKHHQLKKEFQHRFKVRRKEPGCTGFES
jgi:DNA-binding NarL/FixJ family response regulator